MVDMAKYETINCGAFVSDFKSHSPILRYTRIFTYAYLFVFVLILFTLVLSCSPSPNYSSPLASYYAVVPFASVYDFFFRDISHGDSSHGNALKKEHSFVHSKSKDEEVDPEVVLLPPHAPPVNRKIRINANPTTNAPQFIDKQTENNQFDYDRKVLRINQSRDGELKEKSEKGILKKKQRRKQGVDNLMKSLMNCDLFDGNWVRDESYPLYKRGSCSLIDEQFDCFKNGRPDNRYLQLKWKPKACNIPRFNASHMLQLLTGKRLVFVGDSLNRNMWESLLCILKNSVKDKKKVYESMGRNSFRADNSFSFVFEDYNCTVEFFVAPFLVQESHVSEKNGTTKETLRIDLMSKDSVRYKTADIIVFNTGHWWTHEKTSTGKDYYQEGNHVYKELDVDEAFRKALTTWGRWIDANVNTNKSLVFFRGYSASHFSGGQWNSGGQCDNETEPITNENYITPYPPKMVVLEQVLRGMQTRVTYLNVTRMTDYRKDAHPSIYRKQHYTDEEKRTPLSFQDCSHWCLPGVPDAWNEILYALLLVKMNHRM